MSNITVWTKQHENVLKELETTGRYIAKREYIRMDLKEQAPVVLEAYDWLVKHGPDRANKPADVEYPVWVSFTNEGTMMNSENTVILELSLDPAIITSVNIAKWGHILNYGYIPKDENDLRRHRQLLDDYGISDVKAVISSNMSIGVNVFFNTLKKLTPILNDFDIEIIEAHHNQKKDAPSGTAMTAFEVIANELDRDPEEVGVYGRQGMVGKRTKEEIGLHAIRGGDIVGDHTVMFIGDGERIEFTHRAHTREVFIAGVIRAIRYIPDAESGIVSSMNDVLGLE